MIARPLRNLTFLLTASLLIVPHSWAGTAAAPDIVDASEDVVMTGRSLDVAVPEVDILAVWWEVSDDKLRVNIRVADVGTRTLADEALTYALRGWNDEYAWAEVVAFYSPSLPPTQRWTFVANGCNVGPCDTLHADGVVDLATNTITVSLPASFFGDGISCPSAVAYAAPRTGPWTHSWSGPVWLRDTAPDAGCGPDLVLT